MLLHAPRTETGVRLVLISLVLATLTLVISPLLYAAVVDVLSADPLRTFWWQTVVMPGIALVLAGALGLSGVAGFLILERSRHRGTDPPSRRWDRSRMAVLVSIVTGAMLIGSGMVAGFVYIVAFQILAAIHAALWVTLALSTGLFLFWTAERIGPPAIRLRQLGLGLGAASGILSGTTMAASFLGLVSIDPTIGGILGLTATATETLSLLTWIVVYGGILARFGSVGPSPVASG